uniref:N-acetyl-D-glucosamine kinase n=1 Tax=Trichuris muris TaxID=70415 RepID=A0A5S6QWE0_TRIMR
MACSDKGQIFAGVDGGASKTTLVLMNIKGKVLAQTVGSATNVYLESNGHVGRVLLDLIRNAMQQADLSSETELASLGLAMSGAENEQVNAAFIAQFQQMNPNIARRVVLTSDSDGALATAFDNGGIVLVAGTGSSCRSLSPDGNKYGCGGWGYLIGDEGSAYWIAAGAIRKVFTLKDRFEVSPGNYELLAETMRDHFKLKCNEEILDHLYSNFQKSNIASFCQRLTEVKDPIVEQLFADAGRALGGHIRAVASQWEINKYGADFRLPVLLVGSLWESFDLMEKGFLDGMRARDLRDSKIKYLDLFKLTVSPAVGACVSAAKIAGYHIPLEKDKCKKLFRSLRLDN